MRGALQPFGQMYDLENVDHLEQIVDLLTWRAYIDEQITY